MIKWLAFANCLNAIDWRYWVVLTIGIGIDSLSLQESESLQVNNAQMLKEIEELRHECHQLMGLLSSHEAICKQTTSIQYHNNSNYSNYFHTFDQNNNDIRHTQPNANSQCTDSYTNNSYYFNSNNNLNMNSIW